MSRITCFFCILILQTKKTQLYIKLLETTLWAKNVFISISHLKCQYFSNMTLCTYKISGFSIKNRFKYSFRIQWSWYCHCVGLQYPGHMWPHSNPHRNTKTSPHAAGTAETQRVFLSHSKKKFLANFTIEWNTVGMKTNLWFYFAELDNS